MENIDDLIKLLVKESLDDETIKNNVLSIPADLWIAKIDREKIDFNERIILLEMVKEEADYIPLVIRLSNQKVFGAIISNEIVNTDRWEKLTDITKKSGLQDASEKSDIEKSISNLVSDKGLFFWFFGLLFSSAFLKALKSITFDGESKLRITSLTYLKNFESLEVQTALIQALDDTDKNVRQLAQEILREIYGDEFVDRLLNEEKGRMDALKESAQQAKEKLKAIFKKIPGMSILMSTLEGALNTASNLSDIASSGLKGGISSVKDRFSWGSEKE